MRRVDCPQTETIIELDVDEDGQMKYGREVQRPCQRCGGRGYYYE